MEMKMFPNLEELVSSDPRPFMRLAVGCCENYAKLYFDAKHLEKGLNRG